MAKRTQAPEAVVATPAVDTTSADASVGADSTDNTVKEPEIPEAQKEPETDVIPAEACEVWGSCDQNSKACRSCPVLDLCKAKTITLKGSKKASGTSTPRVKRELQEGLSKFNLARIGTRSSDLDAALEEFKTYAELAAIFTLSTVKAHIKWLEAKRSDRCHLVTDAEGKIRFELNA
jgi:hypothetical protein